MMGVWGSEKRWVEERKKSKRKEGRRVGMAVGVGEDW